MIVMEINKNRFELALPITTLFIAIFTLFFIFFYCCSYLLSSAGMVWHRIQIALMCWIAVFYIYCESLNSEEGNKKKPRHLWQDTKYEWKAMATYNDNVNGDLSHKHNGKHMAKDVDIIRFLHCTYKQNNNKNTSSHNKKPHIKLPIKISLRFTYKL